MQESEAHRAAAAIWRIESARLIAVLARMTRDIDLAEEIAQDAFIEALDRWEKNGIPEKPGAWLMVAAKHRAIDRLRRERWVARKQDEMARAIEPALAPDLDAALDDFVGDDLLRLVFVACHPVLSEEASVALTLRLLGGLTTGEIARAFLVPEATIAQRITRAKRTLAEKNVLFELPRPEDLDARLEPVLKVIYLVFNEGYSATAGDDWLRPALCEDALRLGRILAELVPDAAEVHGLVSLMEIQASRARARVGKHGEAVLLQDQDRSTWDAVLITRGLDGLVRGQRLVTDRPGPYLVQAAIAACHVRAKTAAETDYARMAALYDALAAIAPSPIVDLNRAVAHAMAFGPAAGLALVEPLMRDPSLRDYSYLPSVRADFLAKLGRYDEARREIARAAALTKNARERAVLEERDEAYARAEKERPPERA